MDNKLKIEQWAGSNIHFTIKFNDQNIGEVIKEENGFYFFYPLDQKGYSVEWLRKIADMLEVLNGAIKDES